jgi:hypothetical protein
MTFSSCRFRLTNTHAWAFALASLGWLACQGPSLSESAQDDDDDANSENEDDKSESSDDALEDTSSGASGDESDASDADSSDEEDGDTTNEDSTTFESSENTDASTSEESSDSSLATDSSEDSSDEVKCVQDPFEQIDAQRIFDDVAKLASTEFEGRLPGTMGDQLSQDYAIAAFKAANLEPVGDDGTYLQHFSTQIPFQSESALAAVEGVAWVDGLDFQVYVHGSEAQLRGEVVDLGYGIVSPPYDRSVFPNCPLSPQGRNDVADAGELNGKVALIRADHPAGESIARACPTGIAWATSSRAKLAHQRGAALVMLMRDELRGDGEACHHAPSLAEKLDFPMIVARRAALATVFPTVEAVKRSNDSLDRKPSGALGFEFDFRSKIATKRVQTANILGVLRGSDPEIGHEVVVVGGHIDHLGKKGSDIYFGADDNASGASIVMELARQFSLCGIKPKRTILFAEFNAEEMGLIGSNYYVEHPVLPLDDTMAMYNFDMVGAGDSSGVLVFGGDDSNNKWITELLRKSAMKDGLDYVIQVVPQKLATDHAAFIRAGIPATFNFSRPDPHPGYHTPDDDINNVKVASLKMVAELYWSSLRRVAMGEE